MIDWEENLFVGLKALYGRIVVQPRLRQHANKRASLKDLRGSLLYLGRLLSGLDVTLFETDDPLLYWNDRIFLPKECSIGPDFNTNKSLYELRTIVAALAIRGRWTLHSVINRDAEPSHLCSPSPSNILSERIPHTSPLPILIADCQDEFPGLADKIKSTEEMLGPNADIWGLLGRLPTENPIHAAIDKDPTKVSTPEITASESLEEVEGRGQTGVEVLPESALNGPENNLPEHVFEKTETIEEYNGLLRKSDDEESLDDHEEALKETDIKNLVRTPERPRSIYRADVMLDGLCFDCGDDAPTGDITYPEWDSGKSAYKQDWCHLSESVQQASDPTWSVRVEARHRRLIHRLKMQFASMTSDWLKLNRQNSGSEFDIDAVVDSQIERLSGHTPSENVYQDRKRDLHDVASMVLLDQSYSTDAWLNDVRVLDIICESILCVGEVLEDYIDSFAIAGFASNTRRACRFNLLKSFHEPWSKAKHRLGAVQPEGYTRMGPPLRHAQELLLNQKARRKIVILLTDGRPCDYDRYEGRYGIQDVKKAIETGLQNGIHTHAFAIEKQAAEYFPQMFTGRHFDILPSPDRLGDALCRRFSRLLTS